MKEKDFFRNVFSKIAKLSVEELCEVYDNTNSFKWDERLGKEPDGFYELPLFNSRLIHKIIRRRTRYEYVHRVNDVIRSVVEEKDLLRYHHLHNLHRTNEQFEEFWRCREIEKETGILVYPSFYPNNICGNNGCDYSNNET